MPVEANWIKVVFWLVELKLTSFCGNDYWVNILCMLKSESSFVWLVSCVKLVSRSVSFLCIVVWNEAFCVFTRQLWPELEGAGWGSEGSSSDCRGICIHVGRCPCNVWCQEWQGCLWSQGQLNHRLLVYYLEGLGLCVVLLVCYLW